MMSVGLLLLATAAPAFLGGLAEDLTKAQSPRRRLFFTAVSAALAAWILGGIITRTDIPGIDWLVTFPVFAWMLTIFAVAGVANSVNIIDGFNGLAAMCVVMMLGSIAYVAFQSQDPMIGLCALAGLGAVMGFFLWNFPAGLIFLGDGGAYFLGFYVAELSVLLLQRNPQVSSPVPAAHVHLPDRRDGVLDVPPQGRARPAGGHARRRAPAQPDLPAPHAVGGGRSHGQGPHQAQLDDGAVPVAAVHDCRWCRR
jgi:UDP-N-acetylmuramyl pentapeptide phosphotransferase/UDP-N-acetylglucosamine-1-phosphate transferase